MRTLRLALSHGPLPEAAALALADCDDLESLCAAAAGQRDAGFGGNVSYSRKVFIPLTRLCRDICSYCTFATAPQRGVASYLTVDEAVAIAEAGALAGCTEALFTLGDKPELRYAAARDELARLGYASTLDYLGAVAQAVFEQTGLLPHLNPGVMSAQELVALRPAAASVGLMLESASDRLCERGGPHFGSPDKRPAVRLGTIAAAGECRIPATTGILVGIGETRRERVEALLAIRALHERHGHIQEVIIQNFRAKPGTRMAASPHAPLEEHLWTIAVARLVLGPAMSIQAPPNLAQDSLKRFVEAGLNDWGGVSPVTADHVNPEAPWPTLARLREETERAGKCLVQRLPVYPPYLDDASTWLAPEIRRVALRLVDGEGFVRTDPWSPGLRAAIPAQDLPASPRTGPAVGSGLVRLLARASRGERLEERDIVRLLSARAKEYQAVCRAADERRATANGARVGFVVNRNINYTNICSYHCRFCAFSKGASRSSPRDAAYDLSLEEIQRRTREAWERGATEVCMQGGIHPDYTGDTYLAICRAVKAAAPRMHVHAFSPLEIVQGARTLDVSVEELLAELARAGLGSLPGTAAEILDDDVRRRLCPDKIGTREWVDVMRAAHELGLRSTATILFGHLESPVHVARHLLVVRDLQEATGGFTEFVPLPFVHMDAPLYRKGEARRGPTFRETVLLHAVARLAFAGVLENIQVSWTKCGPEGAAACLAAGASDLGGTLMNESISRAAGASHGQERDPAAMEALIASAGRTAWQRTTLYQPAPEERREAARAAKPLAPAIVAMPRPTRSDAPIRQAR